MAFTPLLPTIDPFRTPFQRPDIDQPETRFIEPGKWWTSRSHDLQSACWPAQTMVIDTEFTGTSPNTGDWVVTVTPVTSHSSSAGAAGMGPATVTIPIVALTLAQAVQEVIDAVNNASSVTALSDIATWSRFRSYVTLSISPTGATHLRATATGPDQEFTLTFVPPAGNVATQTEIATPSDSTIKVGLYCALDMTKGINGRQVNGDPFVKIIEASTPGDEIVGPVYLGANTQPVEPGFPWREYKQGTDLSLAKYGEILALGETIIPGTSVGTPVYARHTQVGDNIPGLPTDAAGAAAGATANVWTGTPTVVDSTLYQLTITIGDVVETIVFTSGVGTTDILINAGLAANLLTKTSLAGLVTASGTTTLILTGPADGRGFTPVDIGPGTMGLVETTPAVSTHTLITRGDKWIAASVRIGSAPVSIPHSNA